MNIINYFLFHFPYTLGLFLVLQLLYSYGENTWDKKWFENAVSNTARDVFRHWTLGNKNGSNPVLRVEKSFYRFRIHFKIAALKRKERKKKWKQNNNNMKTDVAKQHKNFLLRPYTQHVHTLSAVILQSLNENMKFLFLLLLLHPIHWKIIRSTNTSIFMIWENVSHPLITSEHIKIKNFYHVVFQKYGSGWFTNG